MFSSNLSMRMSRTARVAVAAALGYVALSIAYSWPLAIRLSSVPHDPGDPLLTTWFLWWSTQAVPLTTPWWNAPMFYPATGVLAFSEHLLGLAPIAAPLNLLTGQPLIGHNVAFIATYALSAHRRALPRLHADEAARRSGRCRRRIRLRAVPASAGSPHPGPRVALDAGVPRGAAPLRPDRAAALGGARRPPPGSCRRSRAATTCSSWRSWSRSGSCGSRLADGRCGRSPSRRRHSPPARCVLLPSWSGYQASSTTLYGFKRSIGESAVLQRRHRRAALRERRAAGVGVGAGLPAGRGEPVPGS